MMMKEGKDEAIVMNPMFPRLHVNDTDKGGPRAPPRNKMALYEELSFPSQRSNSGSQSVLNLPPNNSCSSSSSLVPSISSSHGADSERSMFVPFSNSRESWVLAEKFRSYSIPGIKAMKRNQEIKSGKASNYHSSDSTPPIPAVSNPLHPLHFSNFKKFSLGNVGSNADLRVPTSVPSGIDKNCCSSSQDLMERSSSDPSKQNKNAEALKRPQDSCNRGNKSSSVDILNSEDGPNARLHQGYVARQDKMISRETTVVESDRCSKNAPKANNESGNLNALEIRSKASEEEKCGDTTVGGVNGDNNIPCPSTVESISPLGICPDDVIGIIGQKHFWKLRRAIVHQQRIFAVQVFELHRLTKVQRLIAGSPHMLIEDTFYMDKPSFDVSPVKKLPSDYISETPIIGKVKDNSEKLNISIELADDNGVMKLPLPSADDDTSKGPVTKRTKYGLPYSGNALSTPMAANAMLSPWGFSPPGNQWLVPVMSPSEGLVYKPYTGPYPPTAGFLAPVYGSCGPVNLGVGGGDFLNAAYVVPASQQHGTGILPGNPPIDQSYFPHYAMPVRNPSVSSSAVDQMSPFTRVQSKGNQLSTGDVNFTIAQQSSCNMSSQMSQAISYCVGKLPASKESEIQGSTASSPSEWAKGDELPLFPTKPTTRASNHNAKTSERQTRVIRVIPHSRRLASESAAKIFRSIQEERKLYD